MTMSAATCFQPTALQQQLMHIEDEYSATIAQHIDNCQSHDDDAIKATNAILAANKDKEHDAMQKLLQEQPLNMCIVHDCECEINKKGMKAEFADLFNKLTESGIKEVSICNIDIWIVAVWPGNDQFVVTNSDHYSADGDKPSDMILWHIQDGRGNLRHYGKAMTPKEANRLLKDDGFFQKD